MSHLEDDRDGYFAQRRIPGRYYVSKRFPHEDVESDAEQSRFSRFAYQVFDAQSDVSFQNSNGWEVVLRETPTRQQLKALFFEDDRQIERIAFQRFYPDGRRIVRESFRLEGQEIADLASFLTLIRSSAPDLSDHTEGVRILPAGMDALLSDETVRAEVFRRYRDVFVDLFEAEVDVPEIKAFARRRNELDTFHALLHDQSVFESRRSALKDEGRRDGPEDVWQAFFESNKWIFGAGLAAQFLHSWDPHRLEQTTVGASTFGHGKRPDALLRSAGSISGLVFVEIKTHFTRLIANTSYRSGVWPPSNEVAGGVAQCQTTVDETLRIAGRREEVTDEWGNPSGESAILCRPRSILVLGSLSQFVSDHGVANIEQFEGFERYRRSISDPEIVTFDELLERARMVLELADPSRDD